MKTIKILTISFCIIILLSNNIFALSDVISTGDNWTNTGYNHAAIGLNTGKLKNASDDLYNLLLIIATITAVIVGAILGIKFMVAGLEEKAQIKEALFPYIISCVVVFGSLGIWKLAVAIMQQID